ncbi:hypothetical protein ABES03_15980 [Neobacillus rhizosphaerae]|uniref:hypothetical protein n=1 Tax=Neobacillus rhizosphaerae TaxID=2880965 RepID=UPI003D2767D3
MFESVDWRIFINALSKEMAQKVINRLSEVIGEIEILKLEQYWKDKSQYELECKTKLIIQEPEKAVFYVLQLVSQLGGEINVIGPNPHGSNNVVFEGVCSSPTLVGLSWFYFYIDNYGSLFD